jgi:hypothetical protein
MDKVHIKRYSEAFEKTVVKEYEAGGTIDALRQTNGIGEGSTIQQRIRKYGVGGCAMR